MADITIDRGVLTRYVFAVNALIADLAASDDTDNVIGSSIAYIAAAEDLGDALLEDAT